MWEDVATDTKVELGKRKSNGGYKALHKKSPSSKKGNKSKKKSNVGGMMQSEGSVSSWQSTPPLPALSPVPPRPNRLAAMLAITGADLNSRDGAGMTPLHTAVIWGRLDLCQLLLDSGADPNSTDVLGRTPLQLSTQYGHNSLSNFIISRGGC